MFSSIFGGKQYNQVADLMFPSSYTFDKMVIDVSINMAIIHQMILRYISNYFASLCKGLENGSETPIKIGILKYETLILLLKHKYLNAPSEDVILLALEAWMG